MKKLALNLDALQVETFDTSSAASSPRGTVRGNGSFLTATTFTETMVETTTDPNLDCMCHSGDPCVNTLATACAPECEL